MEDSQPKELENKWRNPDGTFKAGHPDFGAGRPKGKTIKERVKDYLEEHPEDMAAFVEHFVKRNRELGWQMLEGIPKNNIDLEIGKLPFTIVIEKPDEPRDTTGTGN